MKIFILVLLIVLYVSIIALPKYKHILAAVITVLAAGGCLIFGELTFGMLLSGIDFNVFLMLVGIMVTAGLFSDSGMPNRISDNLISKTSNALIAIVVLVVLSGIVSAFMDNVATVLMMAPIGIAVARKADISPVPVIIAIAVSSNLQGAATLVGDTTSVMLAGFADMSFFDFFFLGGKFSIFWAVELGAVLTLPILIFIFRKSNKKIEFTFEKVKIKTVVPTVLLIINLVLLIASSFITDKFYLTNGIICLSVAAVGLVFYAVKFRKHTVKVLGDAFDYKTILFLFCLFAIITCVERVGIISDISSVFAQIGSENVFLLYTVIVFGSVIISAFIDNIPYVATMLPVIKTLCLSLPAVSPYLLYFGLLCGATLGGNLTPFGASANVVGIGVLNKEGEKVTNKDFFKIGIPFTLVAVLGGYLFCWLVWGV